MTDQAGLGVYQALGTVAGCLEGAQRVCVPGGGGDSVSADTSSAGPRDEETPLNEAVTGVPRS